MQWQPGLDSLFVDHDILLLFDLGHDGIEEPASAENRHARIGDCRPAAWFAPFTGSDPRDPRSGFRRRESSRARRIIAQEPVSLTGAIPSPGSAAVLRSVAFGHAHGAPAAETHVSCPPGGHFM